MKIVDQLRHVGDSVRGVTNAQEKFDRKVGLEREDSAAVQCDFRGLCGERCERVVKILRKVGKARRQSGCEAHESKMTSKARLAFLPASASASTCGGRTESMTMLLTESG